MESASHNSSFLHLFAHPERRRLTCSSLCIESFEGKWALDLKNIPNFAECLNGSEGEPDSDQYSQSSLRDGRRLKGIRTPR